MIHARWGKAKCKGLRIPAVDEKAAEAPALHASSAFCFPTPALQPPWVHVRGHECSRCGSCDMQKLLSPRSAGSVSWKKGAFMPLASERFPVNVPLCVASSVQSFF